MTEAEIDKMRDILYPDFYQIKKCKICNNYPELKIHHNHSKYQPGWICDIFCSKNCDPIKDGISMCVASTEIYIVNKAPRFCDNINFLIKQSIDHWNENHGK